LIDSPEEADAADARIDAAERAFAANVDPTARLRLVREILRLRMALNDYTLRRQVRTARERREAG
jgi:hypothetical protein